MQVSIAFFFEGVPRQELAGATKDAASAAYVSEFLASTEGLSLTRAFMGIKDTSVRRRIVGLVQEIGDSCVGGERSRIGNRSLNEPVG